MEALHLCRTTPAPRSLPTRCPTPPPNAAHRRLPPNRLTHQQWQAKGLDEAHRLGVPLQRQVEHAQAVAHQGVGAYGEQAREGVGTAGGGRAGSSEGQWCRAG